ncbi:MAG TPA: DsbA family protein [Phenylobacterium sp.]|jgi:protein-disulfide isomerase|uniref:DsbA family protein n=1 Tax=Phenylobacterium sp. TaxID=1871053 RepID=UPI002CBA6279|nr:DsbA family protein [Phenylobacterium sp.]HXA38366.1 DsbA family protein [Phenylobacterium sp.]
MLNRRSALIAAAAALAAGAAVSAPAPLPDDMSLGNPKAKIEVIEYASLSCPHCGHFNEAVFPALKAKYIDTGKVRYTLKEMLTEPANVAAAGFLLARCAGPGKYFTVVDQVFRSQPRWTEGNVKPILAEIGAANGVDAAHFDACLQDQAAVDAVVGRAKRAAEQDGVNSTPTLFVNGKKIDTVPLTPEDLDAVMASAAKGPSSSKGGR